MSLASSAGASSSSAGSKRLEFLLERAVQEMRARGIVHRLVLEVEGTLPAKAVDGER